MIRVSKGFVRNTAVLFLLWLLLSGRFEPFFIILGLISSAAIAWLHASQPGHPNPTIPFFRFMVYLPWLFYRIFLSNLQVAFLLLNPKLSITPKIIRYQTRLRNPAAIALLANSITLTPGTVTAEVTAPELIVHTLDEALASDLTSERLERKIGWVFERDGGR